MTGISAWDEFGLMLPTGCENGVCGSVLDFNGAMVANLLATSQSSLAILPPPALSPAVRALAPAACPSNNTYSAEYNFASSNLAAAQTVAYQLSVSPAEILGLASVESRNGASNIAVNYNNYFGLTGGPAFGGTIDTYTTPDGRTFGVYPSPGFLNSGLSFANSFHGQRVSLTWGSPQLFVNALTNAPSLNFNSEPGTANIYLSRINLMSLIIPCL
jgi:hypothetical protein